MTIALTLIGLLVGALLGALIATRVQRQAAQHRIEDILRNRDALSDQVRAATSGALREVSDHLVAMNREMRETDSQTADAVLQKREAEIRRLSEPIAEGLKRIEKEVRSLDEQSKLTGRLLEQVGSGITGLTDETARLKKALRQPQTRGAWGEVQMRRCIELAGMTEHIDFDLQHTLKVEDSTLRPDALVNLPGDRLIVMDSKISLEAYLDALEAETEGDRRDELARHARHVREHIRSLASKRYQDQFKAGRCPDFVICFIASEGAMHAAFEADADLFGYALGESVLIATPTNLIGILRTIELGWRQESLAAEAQQIADAARELHGRFGKFLGDMSKVGRSLGTLTGAYNDAVGSLQGRVLPQLRRVDALGAGSGKELEEPAEIDKAVRELTAPELEAADATPLLKAAPIDPQADAA